MMKPFIVMLLLWLPLAGFSQTEGPTWKKVGTGTNGAVLSMCEHDGGLIIGGAFTTLNGFERVHMAYVREYPGGDYGFLGQYRLDLNSPSSNEVTSGTYVHALASDGSHLHLGGSFFHPSFATPVSAGYAYLSDTNSSTYFEPYNALLDTAAGAITAMHLFDDRIWIGGTFTDWNGSRYGAWVDPSDAPNPEIHVLDSIVPGPIQAFEVLAGVLYAAGSWIRTDTDSIAHPMGYLLSYDGAGWQLLTDSINGPVFAMARHRGKLYLGGAFDSVDSVAAFCVAVYDSGVFGAVSGGFTDTTDTVFSLSSYGDTLYAGGRLRQTNTGTVSNFCKWTATEWKSVGTGTSGPVRVMKPYRGRLYVGGDFQVANALVCRNIFAYNDGEVRTTVPTQARAFTQNRLMPNPVLNVVRVEHCLEPLHLTVYDAQGALVAEQPQACDVDTSTWPAGMYFFRIIGPHGETEWQRIMKISQ